MRSGHPYARPGQAIGLLGGSFDPAHAGHLHVTQVALRQFGLDRVWWLVSPGNPLKDAPPAPMVARVKAARALVSDRRIVVTDIEEQLGTRHTAQTLAALLPRYPGVRFVWLMGADNLAGFHHWRDWQAIADSVPIGVVARPGGRGAALSSPMARRYRAHRLTGAKVAALADHAAPAWAYVSGPLRSETSTAVRARGDWPPAGGASN